MHGAYARTVRSLSVGKQFFIGQFGDDPSALSYLNARYYDAARGQFTSQDPVFWEVGMTQDGKAVLQLPQLQNSYSYAAGNPIGQEDPQGRCPACPFLIAGGLGAVGGVGVQAFNDFYSGDFGSRSWQDNAKVYSVVAGQGVVACSAGVR